MTLMTQGKKSYFFKMGDILEIYDSIFENTAATKIKSYQH